MHYDIYAIVSDSAVHKYGNWTLTASAFWRYGGKGVMPDQNDAENHGPQGRMENDQERKRARG